MKDHHGTTDQGTTDQGTTGPGPGPLTWQCHVCGETRPDEKITVLTRDRSDLYALPRGTVAEHIRYCNDKPQCVAGSKFKSFFPPFAPVDSANLFAVGLQVNGQICIQRPVEKVLDRAYALNLAAWLRVIADPEGREFERLVEEIER